MVDALCRLGHSGTAILFAHGRNQQARERVLACSAARGLQWAVVDTQEHHSVYRRDVVEIMRGTLSVM